MAFKLTTQINVQVNGPQLKTAVTKIRQSLHGVKVKVSIEPTVDSLKKIRPAINAKLLQGKREGSFQFKVHVTGTSLKIVRKDIQQAVSGVKTIINATINKKDIDNFIDLNAAIKNTGKQSEVAGGLLEKFGRDSALAVRRFMTFTVATSVIFGFIVAIKQAVKESIQFERQIVKVSQVTGRSIEELSGLKNEITSLSIEFGVSSIQLADTSRILSQTGLSAQDVTIALRTLAKTQLAPTFGDLNKTTEASIAIMRQFGKGAEGLEKQLSAVNAVAGKFAVESDDIAVAVRRTGGAFKAAGGDLNELIALFTSVRSTTRESAESIATGFRTIFTRLQRTRTQSFLSKLGIDLQEDGQFVGPLKAIERLSTALSDIKGTDPRFAAILEELGGFRQISKAIPLIQQFATTRAALNVIQREGATLDRDAALAQETLAVRMQQVKQEFVALIREVSATATFKTFVDITLRLAQALIKVADSIKPLIPLITVFGGIVLGRATGAIVQGFIPQFLGKNSKKNQGGLIPGRGPNIDTVAAVLTKGEFVLQRSAVDRIGADNLRLLNAGKFNRGGPVGFHDGGGIDDTYKLETEEQKKLRLSPTNVSSGGIHVSERSSDFLDKQVVSPSKAKADKQNLVSLKLWHVAMKKTNEGFNVLDGSSRKLAITQGDILRGIERPKVISRVRGFETEEQKKLRLSPMNVSSGGIYTPQEKIPDTRWIQSLKAAVTEDDILRLNPPQQPLKAAVTEDDILRDTKRWYGQIQNLSTTIPKWDDPDATYSLQGRAEAKRQNDPRNATYPLQVGSKPETYSLRKSRSGPMHPETYDLVKPDIYRDVGQFTGRGAFGRGSIDRERIDSELRKRGKFSGSSKSVDSRPVFGPPKPPAFIGPPRPPRPPTDPPKPPAFIGPPRPPRPPTDPTGGGLFAQEKGGLGLEKLLLFTTVVGGLANTLFKLDGQSTDFEKGLKKATDGTVVAAGQFMTLSLILNNMNFDLFASKLSKIISNLDVNVGGGTGEGFFPWVGKKIKGGVGGAFGSLKGAVGRSMSGSVVGSAAKGTLTGSQLKGSILKAAGIGIIGNQIGGAIKQTGLENIAKTGKADALVQTGGAIAGAAKYGAVGGLVAGPVGAAVGIVAGGLIGLAKASTEAAKALEQFEITKFNKDISELTDIQNRFGIDSKQSQRQELKINTSLSSMNKDLTGKIESRGVVGGTVDLFKDWTGVDTQAGATIRKREDAEKQVKTNSKTLLAGFVTQIRRSDSPVKTLSKLQDEGGAAFLQVLTEQGFTSVQQFGAATFEAKNIMTALNRASLNVLKAFLNLKTVEGNFLSASHAISGFDARLKALSGQVTVPDFNDLFESAKIGKAGTNTDLLKRVIDSTGNQTGVAGKEVADTAKVQVDMLAFIPKAIQQLASRGTQEGDDIAQIVEDTFVKGLGGTVGGTSQRDKLLSSQSDRLVKSFSTGDEVIGSGKLKELLKPENANEFLKTAISAFPELAENQKTTKDIMSAAVAQHQQQNKEIQRIRDELVSRVGVLEKWRHVLIGGAIVIGFILHKFINFNT